MGVDFGELLLFAARIGETRERLTQGRMVGGLEVLTSAPLQASQPSPVGSPPLCGTRPPHPCNPPFNRLRKSHIDALKSGAHGQHPVRGQETMPQEERAQKPLDTRHASQSRWKCHQAKLHSVATFTILRRGP